MLQSLSILLILVSFQYLLVSMRRLCCYQGKVGQVLVYPGCSSCHWIIFKKQKVLSTRKQRTLSLLCVWGFVFVFFPPIAEDGSRMGLNSSFLNLIILFQFLHIVVTTINFIYFSYNLLLMLGIVLTLLPKKFYLFVSFLFLY